MPLIIRSIYKPYSNTIQTNTGSSAEGNLSIAEEVETNNNIISSGIEFSLQTSLSQLSLSSIPRSPKEFYLYILFNDVDMSILYEIHCIICFFELIICRMTPGSVRGFYLTVLCLVMS